MKRILSLVAGVVLISGSAWAVPVLTLSSNGKTLTIDDNDLLSIYGPADVDPAPGVINIVSTNLQGWSLFATVGTTKPAIGTAAVPEMDVVSFVATSSGSPADDLSIFFSETDFGPLAGGLTGFELGIGGTTAGSVRAEAYLNGAPLLDSGVLEAGAYTVFGGGDAVSFSPDGLFDLEMAITIHHDGAGSTSFDANLHAVPEPTTMVLLGSGLVGLAGASRRRSKKS